MKKKYPKTLYLRQTTNADGKVRLAKQVITTKSREIDLRLVAHSMEPNVTTEISETPFKVKAIKLQFGS